MKDMKNLMAMVAIAACFVVGCKTEQEEEQPTEAVMSPTTYAVVVGMENSDCFGSCPGAAYDAQRMRELLSHYTENVTYLTNKDATYKTVTDAMKRGVANGELFILYYSGHGGSEPFADTGSEEKDGQDEFLCLNDTFLRDNDIWNIISKSKGRTMLIVDACHSATIMRNPICFDLERFKCASLKATTDENFGVNIECWSGCPDDTYSYGSSSGGKMTNTILKYFDAEESYDSLWKKVEDDKSLQKYEFVQRTRSGNGFGDVKVFQ